MQGAFPVLADLLGHPLMRGVESVGGTPRLDGQVVCVNLIEVFDDYAKIKPGDFILTTGFAWEQYCPDGAGTVRLLKERGAVALAFQEDIYQRSLPRDLLQAALAADFPLLTVPRDFSFRQLSQAWAELRSCQCTPPEATKPGIPDNVQQQPVASPPGDLFDAAICSCREAACHWSSVAGWEEAIKAVPEYEALMATIATWCKCQGSISLTASELGVHRHTVRHRLQHFSRVTGLSLEDQRTRILLELRLLS